MPSRFDYRRQAVGYDSTRSASPAVVAALEEALRTAPGPQLLDVGGGTGNYALALSERGFEPLVVDVEDAMLAQARAKGLRTVRADAMALPFADCSWDAVALISMLHHVADWRVALREARRVLRPGGMLVLFGWSREHVTEVAWIGEYLPSMQPWLESVHLPLDDYMRELPGARFTPVELTDLDDATVGALQRFPEQLLDPEWHRQTSFFELLAERDPRGLEDGLARLAADLERGRRPDRERAGARARWGDAAVLAWEKPRDRS